MVGNTVNGKWHSAAVRWNSINSYTGLLLQHKSWDRPVEMNVVAKYITKLVCPSPLVTDLPASHATYNTTQLLRCSMLMSGLKKTMFFEKSFKFF